MTFTPTQTGRAPTQPRKRKAAPAVWSQPIPISKAGARLPEITGYSALTHGRARRWKFVACLSASARLADRRTQRRLGRVLRRHGPCDCQRSRAGRYWRGSRYQR